MSAASARSNIFCGHWNVKHWPSGAQHASLSASLQLVFWQEILKESAFWTLPAGHT
jgi:hypothetical protein